MLNFYFFFANVYQAGQGLHRCLVYRTRHQLLLNGTREEILKLVAREPATYVLRGETKLSPLELPTKGPSRRQTRLRPHALASKYEVFHAPKNILPSLIFLPWLNPARLINWSMRSSELPFRRWLE